MDYNYKYDKDNMKNGIGDIVNLILNFCKPVTSFFFQNR